MQTVTAEWLHTIDQLREVPEVQLQWVIDNSSVLTIKEGEFFFRPGMPAIGTYFMITGKIHIYDLVNQEMRDVVTLSQKTYLVIFHFPGD